jgi:hypothetical protein
MEMEFCEFSPELEDHFEIFEHIQKGSMWLLSRQPTQKMRPRYCGAASC